LSLLDRWRRRWWRADPAALRAFDGLKPLTVVTGGSEGIGFALALRFARAGHDLLLIARDDANLRDAAGQIRAQTKVTVEQLALDITSPDAVVRLDAALAAKGAYCDLLINNAGIGLSGDFSLHSVGEIDRLIDLNIKALSRLTHHVLPGMRVRGRGGILNVASLGGYMPGPYQALYYASKAFVISLTEAIAHENRGLGLRIAALVPGPVATEFHKRMGAETGLYMFTLPVATPAAIARSAYWRFKLGQRIIVPGLNNMVFMLALRLLPRNVTAAMIGPLIQPRNGSGRTGRDPV
jgi:uncharacterized protein